MQLSPALFPALNACLNGASAVLIGTGLFFIRSGRIQAHKRAMLTAFVTSCLFLASYLYYHARAGVRYFHGQGWIRPAYFAILISHTILAAAIVPLAVTTVALGLSSRFANHRRIARWTLPLWLYVSLTGVVVYVLLYRLRW